MKEIQTPAGKTLLLKVLKHWHDFRILESNDPIYYLWYDMGYQSCDYFVLPQGNWQILNTASKLTEEQIDDYDLVEKFYYDSLHISDARNAYDYYVNYMNLNSPFTDRLESFVSLMKSNKCYVVNPYSYPTKNLYEYSGQSEERYKIDFNKWQEAEENTGEWLILTNKLT